MAARNVFVIIIVLAALLLTSCAEDSETEKIDLTYEEIQQLPEDHPYRNGIGQQLSPPEYNKQRYHKHAEEQKYNKIQVTLKDDEFAAGSQIEIIIENLTGKSMVCYKYAYIDKWDEESETWSRLTYEGKWNDYRTGFLWLSRPAVYSLMYDTNKIYEGALPGRYRFLVFCGGKTFYSPEFTLTEE